MKGLIPTHLIAFFLGAILTAAVLISGITSTAVDFGCARYDITDPNTGKSELVWLSPPHEACLDHCTER